MVYCAFEKVIPCALFGPYCCPICMCCVDARAVVYWCWPITSGLLYYAQYVFFSWTNIISTMHLLCTNYCAQDATLTTSQVFFAPMGRYGAVNPTGGITDALSYSFGMYSGPWSSINGCIIYWILQLLMLSCLTEYNKSSFWISIRRQ